LHDISERTLRQFQEETLAMVSHELRSPLAAAQAYVELLQVRLQSMTSGGEVDAEANRPALARYAERAMAAIRRLGQQVANLYESQRRERGELQIERRPVDLGALVAEIVELAQTTARGQTIRLDVEDHEHGPDTRDDRRPEDQADLSALVVEGDAQRLGQVLLNLLSNAISYAPGTPFIDVRLRRILAPGSASGGSGSGWVELHVQDYGPGIPAADVPGLFTRYRRGVGTDQQTPGGLGLGLFIAHEIITAHGGELTVASQEGKGSTFSIRLPLRSESDAPGAGGGE
jgi:two-component system CheB/CheR fusion protein